MIFNVVFFFALALATTFIVAELRRSRWQTEREHAIIYEELLKMNSALTHITASVAAMAAVDTSVLALVSGLSEQIRNNVDDSDALNALADEIDTKSAELTAAVIANTPQAQPQPTEDPAPQTEG